MVVEEQLGQSDRPAGSCALSASAAVPAASDTIDGDNLHLRSRRPTPDGQRGRGWRSGLQAGRKYFQRTSIEDRGLARGTGAK